MNINPGSKHGTVFSDQLRISSAPGGTQVREESTPINNPVIAERPQGRMLASNQRLGPLKVQKHVEEWVQKQFWEPRKSGENSNIPGRFRFDKVIF